MTRKYITMLKDILTSPTEELGRFSRFVVYQIKLWSFCRKLLIKNRYGQQAAALSYHTIFGIIPLAIVMLLIFQSFPSYQDVGLELRNVIYDNLQLSEFQYPSPTDPEQTILLTDYINDLIARFFERSTKGSITIMSALIVIWAAIGLLSTIERTFNNIWCVRYSRNLLNRIFSYWTPLTLGPLLLGAGIYLTTSPFVQRWISSETLAFSKPMLPYFISVFAFFILYWSIPNTRVKAGCAFWAALVAALIWSLVKVLFRMYITEFIPYSQIYGVLGLIPLTVLWIFITWKIVLFGVQLSYTSQNLKKLDRAEIEASKQDENYFLVNEEMIINLLSYVSQKFEAGNGPSTLDDICEVLNVPEKFAALLMDDLVASGLLFIISDPRPGFMPSNKSENIKLSQIENSISAASASHGKRLMNPEIMQVLNENKKRLSELTLRQCIHEPQAAEQNSELQ